MKEDFSQLEKMGIPQSLVREILDDGVTAIVVKDIPSENGKTLLGRVRPFFGTIELNGNIDPKAAAREIREDAGIDLGEKEIFLWVLLHEWAHLKGKRSESEADLFANEHLCRMRGYLMKIRVDLDIEGLVKKGLQESLGR